ncbi:MAG TPA: hypothetical protein DIT47_06045 [Flavobacteriaceae bacterium]|nr:hypothetical protein [Flavobacteriaceae bacterium]
MLFFNPYLLNLFSSKLIYIVENLDIGFKIKKLREEKNLSQEQLVNLLEISQSKLSKIENGRLKKIEMKLVLKFCKNIDINLDDFLRIQTL